MIRSMERIDMVEVMEMRLLRLRWTSIAAELEISLSSLERWRRHVNFVDPGHRLTPEQLDYVLQTFTNGNSARGERLAIGYVRSLGILNSRQDIRDSLQRVDPVGKELRQMRLVAQRRVYSVEGPNHLWHCDGHHKLIQFGLVTLGCIDGFTRRITYLKCVTDNKKETTLTLFKQAVDRCGLPSRVRGDRGVENRAICAFMIEKRGMNRGSYIPGPSRFNTRIERLWRDVMTDVIRPYKAFLHNMENVGLVADNNVHRFCIQYALLPRINDELALFETMWNNHPIRTENNKSPMQLLRLNIHKMAPPEHVDDEYGAEGQEDEVEESSGSEGEEDLDEVVNEVVEEAAEEEGVVVQITFCPLSEEELEELRVRSPPLTLNDPADTVYERFMHTLFVITDILSRV